MGHQATGYIVPAADWNQMIDNIAYLKTAVSANIFLSAGGWPSATSPAGTGTVEMATNKQNFKYISFADGSNSYAEWGLVIPADYGGGPLTFNVYWMHPATTVNFGVRWALQAYAYGDSGAGDIAWGSAAGVSDTGGTTDDIFISGTSANLALGGSPAAGQFAQFRAYRAPAHADDTMAVAAYLLGILLTYTRA